MPNIHQRDIVRVGTNLVLAALQPLTARLHELTGWGRAEADEAARSEGPITPAPATFAIWGPIFLLSMLHAGLAAAPKNLRNPVLRRVGRWTGLAYLGNVLWSLNSQFLGLGWQSVGIIATSAAAATKALVEADTAHEPQKPTWLPYTIAPLAGWLTTASFVNVETTLNKTHGKPDRDMENARAVALLAGAVATASIVNVTRNVNPLYTAAVGIGAAGIAIKNARDRNTVLTVASCAGLVVLGATCLAGMSRKRSAPSYAARGASPPPIRRAG